MLVDGNISGSLAAAAADAARLEAAGYDLCATGETSHDALLPLAIAAGATERISLGTTVMIAFGRTPMVTAQAGWDLQGYSGGRVILGLGSQIKPHIERRFSMPWSKPAARMREYVLAMHAIWDSWQNTTKLEFAGEFYNHTLMTPMFDPGPVPGGHPLVLVAAVGDLMTRTAAEVGDGVLLHGYTTEKYSREVSLPNLDAALTEFGRTRADFQVRVTPFIVALPDGPEREAAILATRKQLAFYSSTPAYRPVLEVHGWGDLQTELHAMSKRGEWDAMATLFDDDMLDAFAVIAEPETLVEKLTPRLVGVADRVGLNLGAADPDWEAEVIEKLRKLPSRSQAA